MKNILLSRIKQVLLNVGIRGEDCNYIRFLWFDNISENPQIIVYRFLRVVFFSYLLTVTVKHYANKHLKNWDDFAEKIYPWFIRGQFYFCI